jgi:hypothetical protein
MRAIPVSLLLLAAASPAAQVDKRQVVAEAVLLAVTVEPPKPVVRQCTSPLASDHQHLVHPGDTVRLRVAAVLPDGSVVDVTGEPSLRYSFIRRWDASAPAAITRDGWVRFAIAKDLSVETFHLTVTNGKFNPAVNFSIVSTDPVKIPAGVDAALAAEFPGFRIPGPDDLTDDWVLGTARLPPYMALADLDGNGLEDTALALIGEEEWKVAVFRQTEPGRFKTSLLKQGRFGAGAPLRCPQQISLELPAGEKVSAGVAPYLLVEISNYDIFSWVWSGAQFVQRGVEYGG